MSDLLHKPRRSSTSLSSGILRMRKVMAIDGIPGGPVIVVPVDLVARPDWPLPDALMRQPLDPLSAP